MPKFDVSIVMGSLNRKHLLAHTIDSIRRNVRNISAEIIVIDGGSTDGTCNWLSKQRDVLTIIQPNYKERQPDGSVSLAHSWGEFMNIAFKAAVAPWILMVSDDLILCKGAISNGLTDLNMRIKNGEKIGGGAIFYREYPRDIDYHVKLLQGKFVHINHGFFWKQALEEVGYAEEKIFNFYGSDADLTMRLNLAGWQTVPLSASHAEHLNHKIQISKIIRARPTPVSHRDIQLFYNKYGGSDYSAKRLVSAWSDLDNCAKVFWRTSLSACIQGFALRQLDKSRARESL